MVVNASTIIFAAVEPPLVEELAYRLVAKLGAATWHVSAFQ
jgi:hypothetical protein